MKLLNDIINTFPQSIFVCGYGSGVFQQGIKDDKPMIDLIFVVNDSYEWHKENININSSHYSFIKLFGTSFINKIQQTGGHIYYNTHVQWNHDTLIKYGVININDFIIDLNLWKWLYVSGRLHKPIYIIKNDKENNNLQNALQNNLYNALYTALLLMPENFNDIELFKTITKLSYMGDIRVGIAEHPNKINNIVHNHLDKFQQLYQHTIKHAIDNNLLTSLSSSTTHTSYQRSLDEDHIWSQLPIALTSHKLMNNQSLSKSENIQNYIQTTVATSSKVQTTKGILTAGVRKSLLYAIAKLTKKWKH